MEGKMDPNDQIPPKIPERPTLDYRAPGAEPYKPRTPFWAQMLAGIVAWMIGIATVIGAATSSRGQEMGTNALAWIIGTLLVCIGGITLWLRLRFRWRGFLPGLLIGFGLTCLVPVGIVAVICGMGK